MMSVSRNAVTRVTHHCYLYSITAVRSISKQIQLVSYLRSNAFVGVGGKRLIQW